MPSFYLLALLTFLLDRLSKYLVLRADYTLVELTPFFNLVKVWNKGVAFGLMGEGAFSTLLILLIPLLLIMLIFYARKTDKINRVFLGMILGGGLGNWLDRLIFGAVLDFMDLHLKGYHWPAFNVADLAITLGLLGLVGRNAFKN